MIQLVAALALLASSNTAWSQHRLLPALVDSSAEFDKSALPSRAHSDPLDRGQSKFRLVGLSHSNDINSDGGCFGLIVWFPYGANWFFPSSNCLWQALQCVSKDS
jgi:hypothetical protein